MLSRKFALGLMALSVLTVASPALSQGIEIGPDGVRILEQNNRVEQRRDRYEDRRDRRDQRDRREISERQAVRIARGEGVREVDEVRRTRGSYRVIGEDRRGRDIRVDVDRRTGDVIGVR